MAPAPECAAYLGDAVPSPECVQGSPFAKWSAAFFGGKKNQLNCSPVGPEDLFAGQAGSVPEPAQSRGFEFADVLEQGMGPGVVSEYIEPPPKEEDSNAERRLLVKRGQNGGNYLLTTELEETLLVARLCNDGVSFDIFIGGRDKRPNGVAMDPSFKLETTPARDEWTLYSVRCDQCESRGKRQCGKRELSRMSHYCESVGEGQAFCMDVDLPRIHDDGSPCVRCQVCGVPGTSRKRQESEQLSTIRPKWNAKYRSLTLNFHNRCSMASSRNFQLEKDVGRDARPTRRKLLFGQVEEKTFVLDYMHPLGAVQAFAAALTTSHWE